MVPFESLGMVSYSPSIATMAVSVLEPPVFHTTLPFNLHSHLDRLEFFPIF